MTPMNGTLIDGLVETVKVCEELTPEDGNKILFDAWQGLRAEAMSFGFTPELRDACALLRDRWLGCEPTGIEHGYKNYDQFAGR